MKKNQLMFCLLFLLVLVVAGAIFTYLKYHRTQTLISPQSSDQSDYTFIFADINGDGSREKVNVEPLTQNENNRAFVLVAYDQSGKETARIAEGIFFPEPMKDSLQTVKLIADLPKETIKFDVFSGPHSSETFFFTQAGNSPVIAPVCKVKEYKSFQDCTFWSGELGQLMTVDIDEDKVLDVIEFVDEYPKLGEIGAENEVIIRNEFSSGGLENKANDMIEIAKREDGGRGRKVVWNIYRFGENQFFEEQTGEKFNKLFSVFSGHWKEVLPNTQLISKNQMSKASYAFAEMMKNTWQLKN